MGWTYAFLNSCELDSFHESYSPGVLPVKLSKLQLLQRREVNERLCLEELGVDLELCVHAHGHDVDLIMEASLKINCSLGISSSSIYELILCNHGSDHIVSLSPFLGQVKILVFCRPFHLSNLYSDLPSGIAPVISRILWHYTNPCEFLLGWYSIISFLAWSAISLSC